MRNKAANTLKTLLKIAVAVNMLVIIMQAYNTASTISFAKKSLIIAGNAALSTFESGRRAMLALNPEFAPRFKEFLNTADSRSGVKSIYIFDKEGKILLNTSDIAPPVKFSGEKGVIETDDGIFVYKTIIPHAMGFGMNGGHGGGGGMGRMMQNMFPNSGNDPKALVCAALVDSTPLTAVKSSEISFLAAVILLQIILGSVFFYAARITKLQAEQSKELEMKEREAQMGKMSLVMAHELKNPLSSVKGLMEYSAKKSEGAQQDIAIRCVDELARLDRIVNDFLTYGRDLTIEVGDVEIHSLTHETAKLLELDAASKHITINISGGYNHIKADGAKMKQVLFNLILNALQASPENSVIDIEITPDHLSIINDFAEPIDTSKIGTPFYTTKTVGTGLGIAIVTRILNLHGFQLRISADKKFKAEIRFK